MPPTTEIGGRQFGSSVTNLVTSPTLDLVPTNGQESAMSRLQFWVRTACASPVLLVMFNSDAQARKLGTCQPYADKCEACSDCSKCHWCHDKGGTCSVCLEKMRGKVMTRLRPVIQPGT